MHDALAVHVADGAADAANKLPDMPLRKARAFSLVRFDGMCKVSAVEEMVVLCVSRYKDGTDALVNAVDLHRDTDARLCSNVGIAIHRCRHKNIYAQVSKRLFDQNEQNLSGTLLRSRRVMAY